MAGGIQLLPSGVLHGALAADLFPHHRHEFHSRFATHTYIHTTYIYMYTHIFCIYIHTYIHTSKQTNVSGLSALMFLHDEIRFVMQETTLDNVRHCVAGMNVYVCMCVYICSMPGASTYVRCRRRADEHSTYPSSLQTAPTT